MAFFAFVYLKDIMFAGNRGSGIRKYTEYPELYY